MLFDLGQLVLLNDNNIIYYLDLTIFFCYDCKLILCFHILSFIAVFTHMANFNFGCNHLEM